MWGSETGFEPRHAVVGTDSDDEMGEHTPHTLWLSPYYSLRIPATNGSGLPVPKYIFFSRKS